MELAGLSVAQAVYKTHPISKGNSILVLAGPGNNGKVNLAFFVGLSSTTEYYLINLFLN